MPDKAVTLGIVTQPTSPVKSWIAFGTDYVPSPYVDWISLAAARPVVIPWDTPEPELAALLERVNGLLLPGGPQDWKNESQPYYDRVKAYYERIGWLYRAVEEKNQAGQHFPLWGICQGFEEIILSATDFGDELCWGCFEGTFDVALPLDFTAEAETSRMFNSSGIPALDRMVRRTLAQQAITPNFHTNGIEPDTFRSSPALNHHFHILSTNRADGQMEFVSTIEGRDGLPIYGTQWHPSYPLFLFNPMSEKAMVRTRETVLVMQYLANFLVDEARKNDKRFADGEVDAFCFDGRAPTFVEEVPEAFYNLMYFFGPPMLLPTTDGRGDGGGPSCTRPPI